MIIDSYVHVWAEETPLAPTRSYTPEGCLPIDALLRLLDAHGVDGAVLVQPQFLGTDNTYLLQALADHPDRVRGVAVVDVDSTEAALQDLRAVGVMGVRLNFTHNAIPDAWTDLWRRLFHASGRRTCMFKFISTAHTGRPFPANRGGGCTVVVDHFGRPDPSFGVDDPGWKSVLDLADDGRHRVKLSAPYRLGGQDEAPLAAELIKRFGADALVWGSDCPWIRFEDGRAIRRASIGPRPGFPIPQPDRPCSEQLRRRSTVGPNARFRRRDIADA